MLTNIILASLAEMAVAFVAILFFVYKSHVFLKRLPILLSVAVGAFLGIVFLDLLPEAVHFGGEGMYIYVLVGFLLFFILSRFFIWYHHHHSDEEGEHAHPAPRGPMVLIGDGVHNFIDGALIAFSFMANPALGVVTTLAVLIHEFPQELADYFVLLSAGYSKKKALFWNVVSSSTTLIGALLAYFVGSKFEGILGPALAIAAGNFIYLAASDILPELSHGAHSVKKSITQIFAILFGIVLIFFAINLSGHSHENEDGHADEHSEELVDHGHNQEEHHVD